MQAGRFYPSFWRMENGDPTLPIKQIGYNTIETGASYEEVVSSSFLINLNL